MEVTDKNILNVIDDIKQDIKTADFVSIDSEFTGLEKTDPFDTPTECYENMLENDSGYVIIQLGLTTFRKIKIENNKYEFKTYNFYVYPRLRDQLFKCQGESMSFLALHGFDFNKLFANGISSCNSSDNEKLLEKLAYTQILDTEIQNEKMDDKERTAIPEAEKEHIKKIRNEIDQLVKSEEKKLIELPQCSPFQRKLVYEMVNMDYKGLVSKTINKNNEKVFTVQRIEMQNNDEHLDEYNKLSGLHTILKTLSETKKLIIGHNMILDLIYIVRQFFGPLPKKYNQFKKLVHKLFPNLIDTKYICTLGEFQSIITNTKLRELYKTVTTEPFKSPEIVPHSDEFSYPNLNANLKEHEAGYDAYQTGVCFIGLLNHINLSYEHVYDVTTVIYPCLNKICTPLFNVNCIDLKGSESVPSRSNVFYIKFPKNWTTFSIKKLFKPFGEYYIVWISNTECYVAMKNSNLENTVLENIERPPDFYILTHKEYKAKKNFVCQINDDKNRNLNNKRTLSDSSQPDLSITDDIKHLCNSNHDNGNNTGKKSKSTDHAIQSDKQKKIFIENDEW